MIDRKTYSRVLKAVLFLVLLYIIYSFIYYFISRSKLEVVNKDHNFKLSSILNISEDRLVYEAEYYLKDDFFGVSCLIDSSYYLFLTKLGSLASKQPVSDIIILSPKLFPERNNWFTRNDIIVKPVMSINETCAPFYNVSILPLENINQVEMYVKGEVILKNIINDSVVEYVLEGSNISVSFNDLNKNDFGYIGLESRSSVVFVKDAKGNLYIINIAPIGEPIDMNYKLKVPYKSLNEILKE